MGNVAYICISKNKPLNPYPVVLYKIVGSPPPHLCQKVCVHQNGQMTWSVTSGSYTFIWKFPQLRSIGNAKVNGNYYFWPILCNPAPNTQPCYIASGRGSLTLLFREKNPDLYPRPKFCLCKVRTHATEISQLKLMGNVAYVCISKNKPLNPYPVVLYKIGGPPHPHLCQKVCVHHNGQITWSVTSGSCTFIWKFPNWSQWEIFRLADSLYCLLFIWGLPSLSTLYRSYHDG